MEIGIARFQTKRSGPQHGPKQMSQTFLANRKELIMASFSIIIVRSCGFQKIAPTRKEEKFSHQEVRPELQKAGKNNQESRFLFGRENG